MHRDASWRRAGLALGIAILTGGGAAPAEDLGRADVAPPLALDRETVFSCPLVPCVLATPGGRVEVVTNRGGAPPPERDRGTPEG